MYWIKVFKLKYRCSIEMGNDDIWFVPKKKQSSGKSTLLILFAISIIIIILIPFFSDNFQQVTGDILDTVFNVLKQLSLFLGIILIIVGFVKAMSEDGRAMGVVLLIIGFILILLWLDPIHFINEIMTKFGGYEDKYRREETDTFGTIRTLVLAIALIMFAVGLFILKNHKKIGITLLIISILLMLMGWLDPFGILNFIESFFDDSSGFPYGYT